MNKVLYAATALLLLCSRLFAQENAPVAERPVYFIYATGERTDSKLKVMIISTYIYRAKNFSFPYHPINTGMSLDYYKWTERIEEQERYFTQDFDNVTFRPNEVYDLYGGYLHWNVTHQYYDNVTQHDNSLSAIEKIRTALIEDYLRKGYHVYQVRFIPDINGENQASYSYYDKSISGYKKFEFENLSPLSPLWIPVFTKGDIKNRLASIGSSVRNNYSAGIIVEDKKPADKSYNKSGSGSSSSEEHDDEYWQRQAQINMWQAAALEAQGDSLNRMGSLFTMEALKKYQAAQQLYPSARVQSKINGINAMVNAAQAINNTLEKLGEGIENADPQKKTRHVYGFVNYTGLLASYSKIANKEDQAAMGAFFGVNGHRTFLSFEVRFGYIVSPVYEYAITGVSNSTTDYKVRIQQSSVGLGISGGLNIPLRNLVMYGMYGLDGMMLTTGKKVLTPGFTVDENPTFPAFITKWTFGAVYHIPKTGIGIGIQYNLNSIKGEQDGASAITYDKDPEGHYYLHATTNEKYKFNNAGISFCWAL